MKGRVSERDDGRKGERKRDEERVKRREDGKKRGRVGERGRETGWREAKEGGMEGESYGVEQKEEQGGEREKGRRIKRN